MNIKTIVAIIINLILIFIVLCYANFYIYWKITDVDKDTAKRIYKEFMSRDISDEYIMYETIFSDSLYRPPMNKESTKGPILIFGCSFAYGADIDETETLSYKLGQLTQRPIYNRASSGYGVQHMLFQLQNDKFYEIVPTPEYIIYVYFDGHPYRITTPCTISYPSCYSVFYKKQKNQFKLKKHNFFSDKFLLPHYISNWLQFNVLCKFPSFHYKREKIIIEYIKESRREAQKHFKNGENIKFVVLFYYRPFYETETYQELRNSGFYVITPDDFKIDTKELKYKISETNGHPNGLAWDVIVPVIVDKLNLNKNKK